MRKPFPAPVPVSRVNSVATRSIQRHPLSSANLAVVVLLGFIGFLLVPVTNTLSVQDRIVGGSSSTPGQHPYIVSLRTSSTNVHFCGGTIHTSRFVITAAHCMVNKVSLNVKIVAGSINLASGGTTYSVSSVTSHPNYNSYTMSNDVAVLKTSNSIAFSEQVQPIGISASFVEHNKVAMAVGWGTMNILGYKTDVLQWISLTTISNSICKSMHGSTDKEKITEGVLCTYTAVDKGMCNGDSGGPLVYNNELVGVISWGVPCAVGKPDVYTRISAVFSWLDLVCGV